MKHWIDDRENAQWLGVLAFKHTPITLLSARDPKERLNCIPLWMTGDAFSVTVDEDNHPRGFRRGEDIFVDFEDIGDVIVREK